MASQAVNCSAPDTGNMGARNRTVLRVVNNFCGSQQRSWLSTEPLNSRNNGWSLCWTERFARLSP